MHFRDDRRAQALQVGAVLLLGILVIALSLYQVTVVPQENKEIEFSNYLAASTDMTRLQSDVLDAAQQGAQSSTTVQTGTRYPARALFINPPPPTGSLRNTTAGTVRLVGVSAAASEPADVREYWNGTDRAYSSKSVRFQPGYNRLQASPVVTSPLGVYRVTDNGPLSLTGQPFRNGKRVTLVTMAGDVQTGGYAATLLSKPVSVTTNTVTVNATDEPFSIEYQTPYDATAWNESDAADDIRGDGVSISTPNPSTANVTFSDGTFELRLARVVLGEKGDDMAEWNTNATYLVPVEGNGSNPTSGTTKTLAAEVRDRYNNPVSGTTVTFETQNGTFANGANVTTATSDADGRAAVRYTPSETGNVTVNASFAASERPHNETQFALDVVEGGGAFGDGGVGGAINPNNSNAVILEDALFATDDGKDDKNGDTSVEVTFSTLGSDDREFQRVRLNFYYEQPESTGQAKYDNPTEADVSGGGGSVSGLRIGGQYKQTSPTIVVSGSGGTTLTFTLDEDVDEGDFFTFSVVLDNNEAATYFVVPQLP